MNNMSISDGRVITVSDLKKYIERVDTLLAEITDLLIDFFDEEEE